MTLGIGSRSRRVAMGFAAGMLAAMAGCHAMPVGRLSPTPNRPQTTLGQAGRAALLSATVAMDPPSEMSSIEPVSTSPMSITPAEAAREPNQPAPTPLLDAALMRVKGLDEAAAAKGRPETPTPPPDPSAATPITTPIPTPAPAERPVAANPTPPSPTPEPAKEPEPTRPEDAWRDGVRRLVGLARARLEPSPTGGPAPASPWGLRARVLAWLAEPDLDPDLGQRDADGVRAVLRALDDSADEPPRRGDEVRSAVLVLEEKAPFEITDLRLCSKVDGFGDFEALEPPVRKAGQPVILYCELDGLRFEQTSTGFKTRIAAYFEILPVGGGQPLLARPLGTAEETCRRRRRDYCVGYKLVLPKPFEPGEYRLRLTTKDLTSDRSATREVGFAIAKD